MPKVISQRHQQQGYYRDTPLRPSQIPQQQQRRRQQLATRASTRQTRIEQQTQQTRIQIEAMPQLSHQFYNTVSMQPQTYATQAYTNGGPVQPLPQHYQSIQAQSHLQPQSQTQVTHSLRPSSGAWNPQDDQTLMAARAQGMNWAPIQAAYFPSKTPK